MQQIYCYTKKSPYGDWLEFIHKVDNEKNKQFIKNSEVGVTYRLAVRKDYNLDLLPLKEGDVLIVTCDDAWIDVRPDFEKLHLLRVSNPSFEIKD